MLATLGVPLTAADPAPAAAPPAWAVQVHNNELYCIDVSQAVELDHPRAFDFLKEGGWVVGHGRRVLMLFVLWLLHWGLMRLWLSYRGWKRVKRWCKCVVLCWRMDVVWRLLRGASLGLQQELCSPSCLPPAPTHPPACSMHTRILPRRLPARQRLLPPCGRGHTDGAHSITRLLESWLAGWLGAVPPVAQGLPRTLPPGRRSLLPPPLPQPLLLTLPTLALVNPADAGAV